MTTHPQVKPAGTPTWIDLMTPDIDVARSFYQAVFGWEYDMSGPEFGGYTTARLGTRMTAGIMGSQPDAPPMPTAWSLYFATDTIEAAVNQAAHLGGKVVFPVMKVGTFGSMATCADPTGAVFSFWQADAHVGFQVTDEPGAAIWYELYTSHAAQARDFYTALLGATAEEMLGNLEYYVLKQGDTMLGGIMQIDPSWGEFHPQWVTYFAVANADETMAMVTEHGGKVMSPIDDTPFGRIAALMDPGGATFKIVEPPPNNLP